MRLAVSATLILLASSSHATPTGACETTSPRKTPHGAVSLTECGNVIAGGRRATINIDGIPVLTSQYLAKEDSDDQLGLFIFSRESDPHTACPDRLFLLDASTRPVKIIAFGVRGACNLFESVKWGRDRTTIYLQKGVRFTYSHSTLTPPKPGAALWKSIEPPHTGPGLAQDEAIPFAEVVAPEAAAGH